jgi:hypothetical protein
MQSKLFVNLLALIILLGTSCLVSFKPNNNKATLEQTFNLIVRYDTLAFSKAKDTILYKPNTQLSWSDFKAKPQLEKISVANSSVGFKYDANIEQTNENITVNVYVSAFFIKTQSWKKEASATTYILNHEQRHFDLARYGAQLLANEIASKKMNINNFNETLQTAYNTVWKQYSSLQQQYDTEANHSINEEKQTQWNQTVDSYLKLCKY